MTVQAEHPGQATIAGATLDGSYITIAQFRMTGTFEPRPGSTGMTADHNLFVGGDYYAVMAAATSTTQVNDVTITNNKFQGRFNEDAIRLNRYHDGPDADPYGILIEGNEFSGNVEYGGHNDVLQSVWVGDHLYFRRNYLHDFGGQGFFVKDQASAIDGLVVEDNLILRQDLPCDPSSLCPTWQLSPFQIFGPLKNVSIRHNTVWPGSSGGTQWLRGSGWQGPTVFSDNVMDNLNSDASDLTTGYSASNNTRCAGSGFPSQGVTIDCSPAFVDPANGDYREANGRGVTWKLSDQQFGPSTGTPPPPDTTPPDTTITSGPSDPSTSTSASFSFASTETGSTFECKLDSGAFAACTAPKNYSALSTGSHTFSVRATDAASNTDATPASWTWTINASSDTTPPDTMITLGPSNPTTSTSASFAFTSTEGGSTFECKLDAGAYAACTSQKSYTGLSTGSHTFSVRATDAAGNTDASPATQTWTINPPADTTPPNTTITAGPSNPTTLTTASFSFTSSESGSTFECKLDAGAFAACTNPKAYSGLSTGSHTFSVRATDAAGNTDASPATQTWTINPPADTTPPDTTITSGPSGATNDSTPAFGFSSTEGGSTFACKLDAGAYGACTNPWTTPALADGSHTFSVRATDAAGNTDATPATRSFTVDTVAPTTTITSSPPAVSLSGSGSVSFTVNESATTSQCRLDGGAWTACTSPYQVSGLGIGNHTVDVRSTDAAGNVENPGDSASWTVVLPVTNGPTVTLMAPTANATVGRAVRFSANAASASGVSRVEFWVDNKRVASDSTAPYADRVSLSGVSNGMHTVTARAFDRSGQAASSAALVRVARRTGRARAVVAVSGAARGALVATAVAGPDATRLAGQAPKQRTLRVSLTRCDDSKGAMADNTRLRADGQGHVDGMRSQAGLCVLRLTLMS